MKRVHLASAVFAGLYAVYAVWLAWHPVSLASDDALFFVRAVERFSVLEFSPHFPGYPGFVAWSRLLNAVFEDPGRAVFVASLLAALAIPGTLYALLAPRGRDAAAFAGTLALFQPLLPGLGLGMSSDAAGLELVLLHLVAIDRARPRTAAILLAAAMLTRPSYAVLGLACWASVRVLRRDVFRTFSLAFAAALVPALVWLFAADGFGYWREGLRFAQGHFFIWGNAATSNPSLAISWLDAAREAVGLGVATLALALALIAAFWKRDRSDPTAQTIAALVCAYGVWMFAAQNPENLRHMAPLIFLGIALIAHARLGVGVGAPAIALRGVVLAAVAVGFVRSVELSPGPAPLEALAASLDDHGDPLLVSNHGLEVLREIAPRFAVLDAHYARSAEFVAQTEFDLQVSRGLEPRRVLRMSTTPMLAENLTPLMHFPRRNPGERTLILYERSVASSAPFAFLRPLD